MDSSQVAQQAIDQSYETMRPYLPLLVNRLALTYGIPMLLAVLVATFGSRLLTQILPLSTASLLTLVVNLLILLYGWRLAERRFAGTALFILYAQLSRERRDLKRLLAKTPAPDGMTLRDRAAKVDKHAAAFVQAMQAIQQQSTA